MNMNVCDAHEPCVCLCDMCSIIKHFGQNFHSETKNQNPQNKGITNL